MKKDYVGPHLQSSECQPEDSLEARNSEIFLLVTVGRPGFTYNVPTTPLTHWPFRKQTTEQPEVSPEVILDGLAKDSSVLNQVLRHPSVSWLSLANEISLQVSFLPSSQTLIGGGLLSHCSD